MNTYDLKLLLGRVNFSFNVSSLILFYTIFIRFILELIVPNTVYHLAYQLGLYRGISMFSLSSYLVGSLSHKLLCRLLPNSRYCNNPSYFSVFKVRASLVTELLNKRKIEVNVK